jgi:hypothetical protein
LDQLNALRGKGSLVGSRIDCGGSKVPDANDYLAGNGNEPLHELLWK